MDPKHLRNVDLNLLVAFAVLMRERSVSRAARVLSMGQSGMSGALARLRLLFDDPLLVREGRSLSPTPLALSLLAPVEQALELVEQATVSPGGRASFEPARSERTFVIGMTDDQELLFAPALAAALAGAAPAARLSVRATDVHLLPAALDDGSVDMGLSIAAVPSWHVRQPLYEHGYSCVWSPERLRLGRKLSLERFLSARHALVTFRGDLSGAMDTALAQRGLRREIAIGVARFSALPKILETLPLIATVPSTVADHLTHEHALVAARPPIDLPARKVALVHRERDARLPELAWFRALVVATIRGVTAQPRRRTRRDRASSAASDRDPAPARGRHRR